jgi:hypothetical protein
VDDAEVMHRAVQVARDIVQGSVSPTAGAASIWVPSSENDRACFGELKAFIAAAAQWDEAPEHRAALAADARRAAEELLARHPEA